MAESLHLLRGNFLKFTLFFIGCFFFLSTGWGQETTTAFPNLQAYSEAGKPNPTVTSDKDDYSPGMTAIISGSGWTMDEHVDIHLEEEPAHDHHHGYHDTKVNPDGTWTITYPIEERHLGVTFTVVVDGKQTRYQATTIFTDAGIASVSVNGTSFCAGGTVNVSYDAEAAGGSFDNNNRFIAQLSDENGSFSNPINIGYVDSKVTNGEPTIEGTIPVYISAGTEYRIRVVSTTPSPGIIGPRNGSNLTIGSAPEIAVSNFTVENEAGECGARVSLPKTVNGFSITYEVGETEIDEMYLFPIEETTVTATASYNCGETTITFTVTVTDDEDPTIVALPTNISVGSDDGICGAVVTWTAPTAADNCSATIEQTAGPVSGSTFAVGEVVTITYTATDASNNTTSESFTVTVTDDEDPTIVALPTNISVGSDDGICGAVVTWTAPTAADNCSATIEQTAGPVSGSTFNVGEVVTITYTATDASNNTTSESFTVTVTDDEDPTIVSLPSDISVGSDDGICGAVVTWTAPTTADNCSAIIEQTAGPVSGSTFAVGEVVTITYTATDASNNTTSESFTVTVTDDEDPTIVALPTNISVGSDDGICGAVVTWTAPTAADNCSATIEQTAGPVSGSTFAVGEVVTITYTATDASNNTTSESFTVTVTDDEDPTIVALPTNISVGSDDGICGAVVTWTAPTAADNCSATIEQTAGPVSGSTFAVGEVVTITYTATDASNNTTSESFTVTVTDDEDPTIVSLPSDISVGSDDGICGAVVTWTAPTAADNCSATIEQTAGPVSGSTFNVGEVVTITYTATDASNNTTSESFTVTVTDDEDPTIVSLPSDISVGSDDGICGAVVTWTAPTTEDNCSATIEQTAGPVSGSTFAVGEVVTITYTATDASNNTTSESFTVTVTDDEDPTIVSLPSDISVGSDDGICGAVVTWTAPTAADNCSATIEQTAGPVSGSTFAVGEVVTITYTATDASNNTTSESFTVTVTDDEDPTIVSLPSDISVGSDDGICGAVVTWTAPTAADNCSATIEQTAGPVSGSTFAVGEVVTITYTATDASNNTTSESFTVTVTDDEDPTIVSLPSDISVGSDDGICGAVVTWTAPTAADNCSATIEQTAGPVSGSTFAVGEVVTITYTATDASNNTTSESFTVTVTDDEDPTIVALPTDISVGSDDGICGAVVTWTAPTAADNCSATIEQTAGPVSGSTFNVGEVVTITYTATDASNNTTSESFTVTVTDDEDPALTCVEDQLKTNDPETCTYTVVGSEFDPTYSDNCGVISVTNDYNESSTLAGAVFEEGETEVIWTVEDAGGNITTCSFTVTVTNETPLINSITGPVDPVRLGTGFILTANFTDTNLESATWRLITNDAVVDQYTYSCEECIGNNTITGSFNPEPGVYIVELEVRDACGATTTHQYEYAVIYDPTGGFVTGGGWIYSPVGAMVGDKYGAAEGRANFGFNAKYKNGKNNLIEVDGHTNFQFKAGDLHFSSFEHEDMSLVIAGKKATYTGYGTVNGSGVHRFRVIAIDGEANGGTGPDQFRIKIWGNGSNSEEDVLYDNMRGVSESSDLATTLGGGSIVIHKPKAGGKSAEVVEKVSVTASEEAIVEILESMAVAPNPVRDEARVRFSLIEDASVVLRVFDFNGREVDRLFSGSVRAHEVKEVSFQRKNLMSGVYILKLTTDRGNSYDKQIIVE